MKNKSSQWWVWMIWALLWQGLAWLVDLPLLLPTLGGIFQALRTMVVQPSFFIILAISIERVFLALLVSVLATLLVGWASVKYPIIYQGVKPLARSIHATPVMSFIILALLWFPSHYVPVFIGLLMCFPILWTAFVDSYQQVDPDLLDLAQVYQVPTKKVYQSIYFPAMMPALFTGLKTAFGLAWKVVVAAEVLSSPKYGIGSELMNAKVYLETPTLFAWTLVVIFMSLVFEKGLTLGMNKIQEKYGREAFQ